MQIDEYVKMHLEGADKVEKICNVIYPVLDALDYAFIGVVHRDINIDIMIENESNIRLMDLGIARMNGEINFLLLDLLALPIFCTGAN